MAAIYDFPTPPVQYDRRATHRVISDVSALDRINDVDALAQECVVLLKNTEIKVLGTGDEVLVRTWQRLGSKVVNIRRIAQEGVQLLEQSAVVDPYKVLSLVPAGPDAA